MLFGKHNYVLLSLCVAAIVIGFTLMRVENELEGVLSLYVSPLLIMAGYIGVIYAIMWLPKERRTDDPVAAE